MAAAFGTWQAVAEDIKREAAAVRRAVMRMLHAKLAASFGTWCEVAADIKREAAAVRRGLA